MVSSLLFAALVASLFVFSSAGAAVGSPSKTPGASASSSGSSVGLAASSDSTGPKLLNSCTVEGQATDVAYDPADGYVYVTNQGEGGLFPNDTISIVKPPCTVLKTLSTANGFYGPNEIAYDPLTREIVATDPYAGLAYVLQGTSLVKTVTLAASGLFGCPGGVAWDPAVDAMLVADSIYTGSCARGPGFGGVDLLYLSEKNGLTQASFKLDAFDPGNSPGVVLVADGYIFSAGQTVDVFNDRTLAYMGSFAVGVYPLDLALAWDPLDNTVVLGREACGVGPYDNVLFLNADSIQSGKFTFSQLHAHGILWCGAGGVAYSPATREVYVTSFGGYDVWAVSKTGALTHVYLGPRGGALGLAYDPVTHDMYVCAGTDTLFVIH